MPAAPCYRAGYAKKADLELASVLQVCRDSGRTETGRAEICERVQSLYDSLLNKERESRRVISELV